MKNFGKIFFLALLQVGIILVLPIFAEKGADTAPGPQPTAVMAEASPPRAADCDSLVRLITEDGSTVEIAMQDYLFGVVAAEMPASFEPEALKAQAAAARSYALYRIGSGAHDGAVCADSGCCQAWLSDTELEERWGSAYDKYAAAIHDAVSETDGLCISYDGSAILAAFHSSSGGRTESSENVFGKALPYPVSVESREDPEAVPNYITTVSLSEEQLYSALAAWNEEAAVRVSKGALLADAVFSPAGRLLSVKLCGEEVSGSELRRIFSLRSADVNWQRSENGIVFGVRGYGHGVGMSQYGANNMAAHGADFREILSHYYPGTSITHMSTLAEGLALL